MTNKTTLPEEAVQAALDKWRDHEFDGTLDTPRMHDTLTAAAPFLQGVKVKALEWVKHKGDQHCKSAWTCGGIGGWYAIEHRHEGHFDMWAPNNPDGGRFSNLEAAKAAAQADYEARILSALEPSAGRSAVLEEAARALEAWGDIYGDNAAKCVRALALHPQADKPSDDGAQWEWHRENGERSILLYTLRQDGWRKGQPVLVNDVTVRIELCSGSSTDISRIADTILATLPTPPAGEVARS